MDAVILFIERKYSSAPRFASQMEEKGYQVHSCPTGKAALALLEELQPQLVVVNAPTMRTSGLRICEQLRAQMDGLPIVLVTTREHASQARRSCANSVLVLPFTVRKLQNRVRALLPLQSENLLTVGPLELDLQAHIVRIDKQRKSRLTPRLTRLLAVFMQRPGEAIGREELFRQVWNTDFTADTRTLDVHISWLRKALGDDPRQPRFIKTLRGVGYRLDV